MSDSHRQPVSSTELSLKADLLPAGSADLPQPFLFNATELQATMPDSVRTAAEAKDASAKPAPRINKPERCQGEWRAESLDQRLEADHLVRLVWQYVDGLDLTELFENVKAVEGAAGRNATDFRVLFALLLWANIDGVGSAHEIDRLSRSDRVYEWLRGGVPLNYHMLSSFRTQHAGLLDRILSETLACLMQEGLISLETTAQDGMRVRASAGSDSFRREPKLQEHLDKAEQRVRELRDQAADPNVGQRRKKAQERAASDRVERLRAALENHKGLAAAREKRKKGDGAKTRISSTDPDARKMQMSDGGYRPAYNVQFATTTDNKIIVGVDVNNHGNDANLMQPMIEQIQERLGQVPDQHLTDGGFASNKDIEETATMGTTVFTPVKKEEKHQAEGKDPFKPKKRDKPAVAEWRQRMGTPEAKQLYRLRGETAEWVNAGMRNRGMQQFQVRGLAKVKTVVIWCVLAHNLLRALALRALALRAKQQA